MPTNFPTDNYEERKQQFEHEQRYAPSQDSIATWLAHLGRWQAKGHRRTAQICALHPAGRPTSATLSR